MLDIKDAEVYKLAQEIARETGESTTNLVRRALREYQERRKPRARQEEISAIAARIGPPAAPYSDHADLLYDANGLPT